MEAWELHCNGYSSREIAKQYHISAFCGWYVIKRLKEGLHLMANDDSKMIIVREYNPGMDAPLLFSSWRNCLWFDANPGDKKPNPIFFRMTTKKINCLLRDPQTKVKIACLQDDANEIKGYSVITNQTIQFLYVKSDYRKQGIATLLSRGFHDIVKPMTKIGIAIALKKNLKEKQDGREETKEEAGF